MAEHPVEQKGNPPARTVARLQVTPQVLEALLGGNTASVLEVRQQIAENFAKRYLGQQLNDAVRGQINVMKEAALVAVRDYVAAEADNFTFNSGSGWGRATLSLRAKEAIAGEIKTQVTELIEKEVCMVIAAMDIEAMARMAVTKLMHARVMHEARAAVEKAFSWVDDLPKPTPTADVGA